MLISVDLWHKGWGFGFTLIIWERFVDWDWDEGELIKLNFEWQVKLFGRVWGTK